MNKLFVYGTLRYGGEANNLLFECNLLDKEVMITGYSLYDYGLYPFAIQSFPEDFIVGDVYEVSEETLDILDEYEGEMYERLWDKENKFFIYLKNDGISSGYQKISGGNWINYKANL